MDGRITVTNKAKVMKKISILFLITILFTFQLSAQKDTSSFLKFSIGKWDLQLANMRNMYPTYLADPLGIRFDVSSQTMLYSDIDIADEVNESGEYTGKLVINAASRVSLFKFSSKKNPKLGFEIDLGVTIPLAMRHGNHDLISTDGVYYFALAGRPTEWLDLRFSKHHICTHIGDEYPTTGVHSPVDFDPNTTQLPVRDDFILSAAVRPLHFVKGFSKKDLIMVYGDFGFFLPGKDFMGTRQNKPNRTAWLNLQTGAEVEYYFNRWYLGGLFTAYNVSAYQLNSFSPNHSFVAGYIFPQKKMERRVRIGFNYYNGRSLANQFYNRKEKFVAFFVSFDV